MSQMHTCPRRMQEVGPWDREELLDTWEVRDGYAHCSFCGSLHPATALELLEAGARAGPTDKSYKLYIDVVNPVAGQRVEVGRSSGPTRDRATGTFNVENPTITEVQTGRYDRAIMGEAPAFLQQKLYFQHFDAEQQQKFIDLVNSRRINFGLPGHLYTMPFFCRPAKSEP